MKQNISECIPEIDLHGLTCEEAISIVDKELNHTFLQERSYKELRFITGWGSVIRPAIQVYVTKHPLVKEFYLSGPSITVLLEESR